MGWMVTIRPAVLCCGAVFCLVAAGAAAGQEAGNAALAVRLADVAQDSLRTPVLTAASFRAAAALLEAAGRLDPSEPRYPRLRTDALVRAGDVQAAMEALTAYRALAPDDELAQVEQIDLYLGGMQTSDARLEYLRGIEQAQTVPGSVKSHAATLAAGVLVERAQPTEAAQSLARALELDPLNLAALQMQFAGLPDDHVEDRVGVLLQMLGANPAQPAAMLELAEELADAGVVDASLAWYRRGFRLLQLTGQAPPDDAVADLLAELIIGGESAAAVELSGQVLQASPANVEVAFFRLLAARMTGDKTAQEVAQQQLAAALSEQFGRVEGALSGDATTQPAGTTRPADPAALAQRLADSGRDDLRAACEAVLADTAWFHIYYREQPADAEPWLGALRAVGPESRELPARLEGWRLLRLGDAPAARLALAPLAQADPMARLGMLRLSQAEDAAADVTGQATELLDQDPSGLLGATLTQALADLNVQRTPTEIATILRDRLAGFDEAQLAILERPEEFYTVRADPVKAGITYGEPVLLKLVIQNRSKHPITIGAEGSLHPEIWVDAQLRGVHQQQLPAVAFDRLAGPLVLRPRQILTQVIRADQGQLNQMLMSTPLPTVQMAFRVTTNPMVVSGGIGAGPAGQSVAATRLAQRDGMALTSAAAMTQLAASAQAGSAEQKVRALHLLSTLASNLAAPDAGQQPPDQVEARQAAVRDFRDQIAQATRDPDPAISAWAGFLGTLQTDDAHARQMVAAMAARSDWQHQLLALLSVHVRLADPALAGQIAAKAADPVVRDYGRALEPILSAPPATQASTQPASP
jgi:tetratricopeptide (TPR) repeat protein